MGKWVIEGHPPQGQVCEGRRERWDKIDVWLAFNEKMSEAE